MEQHSIPKYRNRNNSKEIERFMKQREEFFGRFHIDEQEF
jgi:hypothetical protein